MSNSIELEAWDNNAKKWREHIKGSIDPNYDKIILPSIERLLGDVKNLRILDLGCGEGRLARFLARKGAVVTGVDFSPAMIDIAKSIDKYLKIDYHVCAADQIAESLEADHYDICIANMSVHCMENLDLVVSNLAKILRNEGVFIFITLHPCFPLRIYETSTRTIADHTDNNPENTKWPKDSYFNIKSRYRKITPDFPSETVLISRMLEIYFQILNKYNFRVTNFLEPKPPVSVLGDDELLSSDKYPLFPVVILVKAIINNKTDRSESENDVLEKFIKFRNERDWQKYQSPKNLAISISVESAELLEHFQWIDGQDEIAAYAKSHLPELSEELADIYLNLILLARDLGISLPRAAIAKIDSLAKRYSVMETKGKAVMPGEKNDQ